MTINNSFLGTGWGFRPTFISSEKGVELTENEQNIAESIRVILTTKKGERVMHPHFGCDLQEDLFQPMGTTQETSIKNRIKEAILYYEPRIKETEITINLNNIYEGKVEILLEYTIIATNNRTNVVFPFYKIEATDI